MFDEYKCYLKMTGRKDANLPVQSWETNGFTSTRYFLWIRRVGCRALLLAAVQGNDFQTETADDPCGHGNWSQTYRKQYKPARTKMWHLKI